MLYPSHFQVANGEHNVSTTHLQHKRLQQELLIKVALTCGDLIAGIRHYRIGSGENTALGCCFVQDILTVARDVLCKRASRKALRPRTKRCEQRGRVFMTAAQATGRIITEARRHVAKCARCVRQLCGTKPSSEV